MGQNASILTEAERPGIKLLIALAREVLPLLHQLLPMDLGLLHGQRPVQILHDHLQHRNREDAGKDTRQFMEEPGALLGWDISGGDDGTSRVHQEEDQDLAVAGACGVFEPEGQDTMLKDIRGSDAAALIREDGTQRLA